MSNRYHDSTWKFVYIKIPANVLDSPGFGILFTPRSRGYKHHLAIAFWNREWHFQWGKGDGYDHPWKGLIDGL